MLWFMHVHGLIFDMVEYTYIIIDSTHSILQCVEFDDATRLTWLACNPLLSSGNSSTDGSFPFFFVCLGRDYSKMGAPLDHFWWISLAFAAD